jgi:hypothetical protein
MIACQSLKSLSWLQQPHRVISSCYKPFDPLCYKLQVSISPMTRHVDLDGCIDTALAPVFDANALAALASMED